MEIPLRINNLTLDEAKEISSLLNEAFNLEVSDFLIYRLDNYPFYFRKLISESLTDYLFIVKNGLTIGGFAHFKLFKEEIFLNNIIIRPELRKSGTGKKLFQFGVNQIMKDRKCKYISLDVFQKNEIALSWYKKVGMHEVARKYWYDIFPILNKKNNIGQFCKIKEDENGFCGLYRDGEKVATMINDCLLFRKDKSVKLFQGHETFRFSKACLVTDELLDYKVIEISMRFFADIKTIKL